METISWSAVEKKRISGTPGAHTREHLFGGVNCGTLFSDINRKKTGRILRQGIEQEKHRHGKAGLITGRQDFAVSRTGGFSNAGGKPGISDKDRDLETGAIITMSEIPINADDAGSAKLVYILYLVSLVFGITSIVGVIMAYINKSEAPQWLESHYQFQIRTFWIGLLYSLIGLLLVVVLIGWIILLFTMVWLVIRCVKGLQALDKREAHPDPATWMF